MEYHEILWYYMVCSNMELAGLVRRVPMERYHYSEEHRTLLEKNPVPFAIYQFLNKRVVTLILSDGFLELFGYEDRARAYQDMDRDMYKDTHPDDVSRIADAAFRFAMEESGYNVAYRTKQHGSSGYKVIHATGRHIYEADRETFLTDFTKENILRQIERLEPIRQPSVWPLRKSR